MDIILAKIQKIKKNGDMAMNQEKIHYYVPFSSKNEDLRMFNYWALQVFEIMDNVTHKQITEISIFLFLQILAALKAGQI